MPNHYSGLTFEAIPFVCCIADLISQLYSCVQKKHLENILKRSIHAKRGPVL